MEYIIFPHLTKGTRSLKRAIPPGTVDLGQFDVIKPTIQQSKLLK